MGERYEQSIWFKADIKTESKSKEETEALIPKIMPLIEESIGKELIWDHENAFNMEVSTEDESVILMDLQLVNKDIVLHSGMPAIPESNDPGYPSEVECFIDENEFYKIVDDAFKYVNEKLGTDLEYEIEDVDFQDEEEIFESYNMDHFYDDYE